jgi:hypothetical protein
LDHRVGDVADPFELSRCGGRECVADQTPLIGAWRVAARSVADRARVSVSAGRALPWMS